MKGNMKRTEALFKTEDSNVCTSIIILIHLLISFMIQYYVIQAKTLALSVDVFAFSRVLRGKTFFFCLIVFVFSFKANNETITRNSSFVAFSTNPSLKFMLSVECRLLRDNSRC